VHNPPYGDWECCLTVGSTSAWDSTLRIFCEKGDFIIAEEYAFSSALETALPMGIKVMSVKMDEQGLIPESLDDLLSSWDEGERGARKPFLLYMVPTGQNPTGATQLLERRKAIYVIAQKHNLYIVEDEPYYYLQLPPYTPGESSSHETRKSCTLIPSYLSLDVDGRVLRLDSLSKVLAPGSRMGWVTASQQVVEKFIRINEVSSQHPSGFSQAILFKLLNHHWGHRGFFQWLEKMQTEYTWRRDTFLDACNEFLPKDIASWNPSRAGMFVSEINKWSLAKNIEFC
jgi:aromatic amino acid aminotransferase I